MTTMHPEFPALFNEISTDGADREARWEGIAAFTEERSKTKIEVLVRLAFGTKAPAAGLRRPELQETLDAFHQAFVDADAAFKPAPRQDQILAAGALLQFFETYALSAIAVTSTACDGARRADLPVDLVTSAENAIARLGASRRERPKRFEIRIEEADFAFEPDFTAVQPNTPSSFKELFEDLRVKIDEAFADVVDQFNDKIRMVVDANTMADEELDMLLWVFGGKSLLTGEAFGDVKKAAQPLVLARDLADRTKIIPGPAAIPALLSRAGVATKGEVTVVDAVDAVSDGWTASLLEDLDPSPASTPIHEALARRQETGAGGGWQAGWAAATGIDAAASLAPVKLAELFYLENIWLRH